MSHLRESVTNIFVRPLTQIYFENTKKETKPSKVPSLIHLKWHWPWLMAQSGSPIRASSHKLPNNKVSIGARKDWMRNPSSLKRILRWQISDLHLSSNLFNWCRIKSCSLLIFDEHVLRVASIKLHRVGVSPSFPNTNPKKNSLSELLPGPRFPGPMAWLGLQISPSRFMPLQLQSLWAIYSL